MSKAMDSEKDEIRPGYQAPNTIEFNSGVYHEHDFHLIQILSTVPLCINVKFHPFVLIFEICRARLP